MTILGYFLGTVPFISHNIDAVLVLIVLVSVLPMVAEYLLEKRRTKAAAEPEA